MQTQLRDGIIQTICLLILLIFVMLVSACGGSSGSNTNSPIADTPAADGGNDDQNGDNQGGDEQDGDENTPDDPVLSALDLELLEIIAEFDWELDPLNGRDLPSIDSPVAQLGKKLFFSKSLGGDFDSACASCHHPMLGGADELSLPVGVGAVNPEILGQGRVHEDGLPLVPRNSPTNFNAGLWDSGMFFDSRVESLGKEEGANGNLSGIRTPDSSFGVAAPNAGANLVVAQAKFPVTSTEEMKSENFENGSDNESIRNHLAARIGNYGEGADELERNAWLQEFQEAFGTTEDAEVIVTFDNIALALGEYQRSLVFVNNPWQNYLDGDVTALSDQQKQGAILFFTGVDQGGAGCANCHNGPLFSDEQHHTVAFPQIGPGKGDTNNDDFGRERETGDAADRYRFRTPSLLNIAQSAPYGHTGPYETLREVIQHYDNPQGTVNDFFNDGGWCQLEQFENINNCANLYPEAEENSDRALAKLQRERNDGESQFQNPNLNRQETDQLVAFLQALTDPCVEDRNCMEPWIANNNDDNPDDQILIATDENGNPL